MLKVSFDFVIASLAIIILLPVFIVFYFLIFWNLGQPVIFKQLRPGLNRKPFKMYKFRSMSNQTDPDGNLLPDANRLKAFGKFLRASSCDELPSLWNVIKGDMSLVGPRPLLMEYLPLYTQKQFRRHEVRPGITGWAQVNGRNSITWEKKFDLDVWYVDNQSFKLDAKILYLTIKKVLKKDGISEDGEETMSKFTGKKE
jgi:lipopolysaccharide/colanic/teichoic acid biosynthesis glycosyltransferase